jgi:hypothetical protein
MEKVASQEHLHFLLIEMHGKVLGPSFYIEISAQIK